MEAVEDLYAILGVGSAATLAEINVAYARKLNVFRRKMRGEERPPVEELDALRRAFRVLGDEIKRLAYDEARAASFAPPPPPAPPVLEMPFSEPTLMVDDYPVASGPSEKPFAFVGNGGEYFRIWIVNIFLTIVTLGIYSAWAKVRREQYFHRNLILDGSGFDYHALPRSILKGRAIVFCVLMLLSMTQKVSHLAYAIAVLCVLPLVPWLAIQAFRFRAHNTSYRGLRFSFKAAYWEACIVFLGYGLLNAMTAGLAFPLFYRQLRKFVLDHLHFGNASFSCSVSVGEIYRIFIMPVIVGALALGGAFMFAMSFVSGAQASNKFVIIGILAMLLPVLFVAFQAIVVPYVGARTANAVWGSTEVGRHYFTSALPIGGFIRLSVVNWLLILLTLGLFIPWARVRTAKYRAEHLSLVVDGDLDAFVAGEQAAASALGDEAAEMMDLDIGL